MYHLVEPNIKSGPIFIFKVSPVDFREACICYNSWIIMLEAGRYLSLVWQRISPSHTAMVSCVSIVLPIHTSCPAFVYYFRIWWLTKYVEKVCVNISLWKTKLMTLWDFNVTCIQTKRWPFLWYLPGVTRFCKDLEVMLGIRVNMYFKICWYGVSPVTVFVSIHRSYPVV